MGKWYKVEIIDTRKKILELFTWLDDERGRDTFTARAKYCGARRIEQGSERLWLVIYKFKDEADAVAFKLRWG